MEVAGEEEIEAVSRTGPTRAVKVVRAVKARAKARTSPPGAPDTSRTRLLSAVTAIIATDPELGTASSPPPAPGPTR